MELTWRKSSHSDNLGGNCIEVARSSRDVAVRDSKDPEGPRLLLGRAAFRVLVARLKG
ncbi:DUF397 domain-containing protein [Actinomadura sp. 9N407]|uniref:DUF397 domain-containing protein n=1 Tax=Actinomadura sp. 9N407 TaxID=3375154 RepID=UPI0037AD4D0E